MEKEMKERINERKKNNKIMKERNKEKERVEERKKRRTEEVGGAGRKEGMKD